MMKRINPNRQYVVTDLDRFFRWISNNPQEARYLRMTSRLPTIRDVQRDGFDEMKAKQLTKYKYFLEDVS